MPAERTTTSPDLLVAGGGPVGLAVAWRAAQRGLSVTVLERDTGAPSGAFHVAAGMLAPVSEADAGERDLLALGRRSAAGWPAFAAELEAAAGMSVGYRATGTLLVARDRDEAEALDRECGLRDRLGVAVERLLPSAARRLEPALAPTLRGALHAPEDHSVDPRALVAALGAAARAAGARVRTGVEVAAVDGAGVTLGDGSRLAAGATVLAAGAWSGRLAGLPVRPVRGQLLRLHGDPLLAHVVRFDGGYLVPRADGTVVLGATMEERGFDARVTAGGLYELLRDASELVPGVLELHVEEVLAGFRPGTPDNAPVLGEDPARPGLHLATGHFRNGILLTPATAEIVVAGLLGTPESHPFGPARFAPAVAA